MEIRIRACLRWRFALIKLLGVMGISSVCSMAFAVAPTATDDTRSITVNSSATLNVLANDFDADGDSLSVTAVSTPQNGTAEVNSDGSIIYVPNQGYIGTDQFTYTVQELNTEEQLTATATVTVVVQENAYLSLGGSNNTQSVAAVFATYCNNLRTIDSETMTSQQRYMVERCNGLETMLESNPDGALSALRKIAPEETLSQMRQSLDSSQNQSSAVSQRVAQIHASGPAFSFNGMPLFSGEGSVGGAAGDSLWSSFGIFASIQAEETEREQSKLEAGYETSGASFTIGMDYRLNTNTLLGIAFGRNDVSLEYSDQGGEFDSEMDTGVIFGAWTFGRFSIETQLSHSILRFESRRNIQYTDPSETINITALGETRGTQQGFSLNGQWEWNRKALTLFPFVRIDALQNTIEAYEEYNVGGYSMGIGEQKSRQTTASTGVQATYAMSFNWGVLLPTFEVSALSEVESSRDDVNGYFIFDSDRSNQFTLLNDGGDTAYYQTSIGASTVMKHGFSGFINYQILSGYDYYSAWRLQAGFRYEL